MENNNFEEQESFEGGFKVNFEDISSNSEESLELEDFANKPKGHQKEKKGFALWWSNRKKWQKGLMISAVAIVLVIAIAIGTILTVFDYNYNEIKDNPENLGFENVIDQNIVNVALFGIDARTPDTFDGLSDSIMILSLDTVNKKVKIVSVMRDSFVPITYNNGKVKHNKINSAYQKGGPELAIKTLNTIFGLDITEYATVNFYGMADIIDAVGGIDAELTKAEVKKTTVHGLNECIDEICKHLGVDASKHHIYEPGKHHLNGIQAVAYSRIRYVKNIWGTNNDYGRTDRQRYVMEQLFNKALTMKKSQYVKLAKALMPCCETSLSYSEIMGLAVDMLLESPTFHQYRMPQEEFIMPSPSGVGSVVYYDLNFAKKLIHAFFYEDISPDEFIAQNGIEKNKWYKNGNSSNNSSKEEETSEPESSGNSNQVGNQGGSSTGTPSSGGTTTPSGGQSGGTPVTGGEQTPTDDDDEDDIPTDGEEDINSQGNATDSSYGNGTSSETLTSSENNNSENEEQGGQGTGSEVSSSAQTSSSTTTE